MASKPGLRKDPEFSDPPSTVFVYEGDEYGSRDHLGHPPDSGLPPDFCESPRGLTPHLSGSRHPRRGGLAVFQVLPNRSSCALRRERPERSGLPLNSHSALGKAALEPGHVTGGPLRRKRGRGLSEILPEARGRGARAGCDRQYRQDHRRSGPHVVGTVRGTDASSQTLRSASAGSGARVTERPITK